MKENIPTRRDVCRLIPGALFVGVSQSLPKRGMAAPSGPLPAAWQALGMSQWPQASGLLSLSFDEIIVPGNLRVVGRSAMPFTQALALFRGQLADVAAMEQVAFKSLSAGDVVALEVMLKVSKTSSLALLARTPAGWFRAEREVKVGRPA